MTHDFFYRIPSDWPATPRTGDEPTHDEVLDVLDQVGRHYSGAVESLAETVVPEVGDRL